MTHSEALEASVKGLSVPQHATALIQLCRTLAGQMDAAGADPSTRLSAAYLSALKDMNRLLGTAKPAPVGKLTSIKAAAAARRGA